MTAPPTDPSEGRLERLEARVSRLEELLARIASSSSEETAPPSHQAVAAPRRNIAPVGAAPVEPSLEDGDEDEEGPLSAPLLPAANSVLAVLSALGVSFLVLGGAFLVRAITGAGAVPGPVGVAVGFAYALAVIAAADRLAGSGRRVLASFLLVTAIGIGDPLLFEALTRFHAIGVGAAAAGLAVLAGACLAASRRRELPAIAWIAVLAAAATAGTLSLVSGRIPPFAAALLAIAIAADWTPGSPEWSSARWPAALAADGLILWMGAAAFAGEPSAAAALLALALPVLQLGGVAVRFVARGREIPMFDVLQGFAAAAIGVAGALAATHGAAGGVLGAAALVVSAVFYAAGVGPLARADRPRRNAAFARALALALALFGGTCVLSGAPRAWLWLVLAAGFAVAGASPRRSTLSLHAAVFAWAAAWQSGLLGAEGGSLFVSGGRPIGAFTLAALATILVAVGALVVAVAARPGSVRRDLTARASRLALALLAGAGTAAIAVSLAAPLAAESTGKIEPGSLAFARSAALALLAALFAISARRFALPELAVLAYALLVVGGVKLLFEDVPAGRPLTLFFSFAIYGAALLAVPKLLRGSSATSRKEGDPPRIA